MTDLTVCMVGRKFECASMEDEDKMDSYTLRDLLRLLRWYEVDEVIINTGYADHQVSLRRKA